MYDEIESLKSEGIELKIINECQNMEGHVMALHKKDSEVYTVWCEQYGDKLFKVFDNEPDCLKFFEFVCDKLDDDDIYRYFIE
jgi:hypothetical protein